MSRDVGAIRARLIETMSPTTLPPDAVAMVVALMKELAVGKPVSQARLGVLWRSSPNDVRRSLERLEAVGMAELDDEGSVIASVITLKPTPHRFLVGEQLLHTWCALDTLFMPGVLGVTARVASTCPETQQHVELRVAPDRVLQCSPGGAHVSLVAPGLTAGVEASCSTLTGSCGAFCSNVHFFADRGSAVRWRERHAGSEVIPVEEAFRLASEVWTAPFLNAMS